jgi:hypothetical protein
LTHAPFNAVRRNKTTRKNQVANTLQQQALGDLLRPAIKMIVSGHIHMFEALSFGDAKPPRAPQLVVGTGGNQIGEKAGRTSRQRRPAGDSRAHAQEFRLYEAGSARRKLERALFDEDCKQVAHCKLVDRKLACKKS